MYTASERREAIFLAREALELLRTDPMGCMEHSATIEDSMMECQLTWEMLSVTESEYRNLLKEASTTCAREIFDRIRTSENQGKAVWITNFEKVLRCFGLEWEDVRIKETEYLRQKHWYARMQGKQLPQRTGTHG